MLQLNTINIAAAMLEEANILPELTAARNRTIDPHGVERLHLARRDHINWCTRWPRARSA